ncbi:MAG: hypothetical protein ACKVOO_07040 [Burkholderiaceae bacterium]
MRRVGRLHTGAWPRRLLALLLLAMLLAQGLAQRHAVVHGGWLQSVHSLAHEHAAEDHGPAPGGDTLYTHHSEAADCRLYGHACGGDGFLTAPALLLPVVLPAQVLRMLQGLIAARWAAMFDARGPPFLA